MENAGNRRGTGGYSDVYKEAIGGFYRTILVCAVGTVLLLSLAFWGWKRIPGGTVGQQEWVAYLGIIFATAVALAGSLVAIMLASRALDSAKAQSELAEQANRIAQAQSTLSDQANKIAERQSTESMMAVDGSARYQQFKSILFTMPIMLRRAQRDRLFDDYGNIALLGQVVQTMGTAVEAFLSSSVPATAAALADTIDLGPFPSAAAQKMPSVPEQRYVEHAVSSLYYDLSVIRITLALPPAQRSHLTLRLQLMRLLDATYALVHELDRVFNRAAELRTAGGYGFSLLQERFIEHVTPVSRLNHDLSLSEDFNEFARQILGENQSIIAGAIPFRDASAESVRDGGMLVSLQDSGLAQTLAGIRSRLEELGLAGQLVRLDDGAWEGKATSLAAGVVPIFLITEQFANRFLQLHHFLASDRASAWPQRVVLLDQVEQAAGTSRSTRYLSFSEQLACWRYFAAVGVILQYGRQMGLPGDPPTPEDVLRTARFAFNDSLDVTVWNGILSEKHDDLQNVVARAAASLPDAPSDPKRHADEVLAMCASLMAAMTTPGSVDFASDQWFPSFDIFDADYLEREETVQLLAQRPLMERPMFNFPNASGGFFQPGDRIDLSLPHTSVFGVAYMDSTFHVPRTLLVELLSANGAYRLF